MPQIWDIVLHETITVSIWGTYNISYNTTKTNSTHYNNNKPTSLNCRALGQPNKSRFNCCWRHTWTTNNNCTKKNKLSWVQWVRNNTWIITSNTSNKYRAICTDSNQCILSYTNTTTTSSTPTQPKTISTTNNSMSINSISSSWSSSWLSSYGRFFFYRGQIYLD